MRLLRQQPFRHFSLSSLSDSLRNSAPIDVHPEVQHALLAKTPVVALESTIVTHGIPYPTNLSTALSVASAVRKSGAVPATIGLINGRIKIGLENSELERLADTQNNPDVLKLSRRDIAAAISMKKDGGTTCSATLIFAALAGIKVFATGGLGGVHRGGENSMDISADLHELTRCPVGLVSAGVKSILDIGRLNTWEETLGVPVLSYAETNDFPGFYAPRSGFKSPWRVDDPGMAARILYTHWQLGMRNGTLFSVPIPQEYEALGKTLQDAVEQAVGESEENGVNKRGKEATPWLLHRIRELTQGKSLVSNIALIENTASVGGKIAVEYSKLAQDRYPSTDQSFKTPSYLSIFSELPSVATGQYGTVSSLPLAKLIVVGSAAIDVSAQMISVPRYDTSLGKQSTLPGTVRLSLGGVGRNVAEAAHRILATHSSDMSSATLLVSPVGDDHFGHLLFNETRHLGMRTDGLMTYHGPSAICNMVTDSTGELLGGVAEMDAIESLRGEEALQHVKTHNPSIVALDGNLSPSTLETLVMYCNENSTPVFFEPTSVMKSTAILPAVAASARLDTTRSPITLAAPNLAELSQMYAVAVGDPPSLTEHSSWWDVINRFSLDSEFRMDLEHLSRRNVSDHRSSLGTLAFLLKHGVAQMAINLLPFFQNLIVKCGDRGVIMAMRIAGQSVTRSGWSTKRSNVCNRYVVAHGQEELVVLQHFPPMDVETNMILNVTGAGDSLAGYILASLVVNPDALQDPLTLGRTINAAQQAAILTLRSQAAVSPSLSDMKVEYKE